MPADPVFLVGAPRSGTTWLQQMLGAHPAIATPQELYLFNRYLRPWLTEWREQLPDDAERWREQRHLGLPSILTEQAFDELLRGVVERIHTDVLALKPGATVVLEKVPSYATSAEEILRLCPRARFVHVVRDGRDAVASMLRAARGWGRLWAPQRTWDAVHIWRAHVVGGRAIGARTDAYAEVRYEELRAESGPRLLGELFAFCGVESDAALCEDVYDRFALGRYGPTSVVWGGEVVRRGETGALEPDGFVGTGGLGAWRRDLRLSERLLFESMAGWLLRELGYTADGSWVGGDPLRRIVARVPLAIDHRLRLLRGRLA